jgi:hypothetical protein
MGISKQPFKSEETPRNVMPKVNTYLTWIAVALILITTILNVRQDRFYYHTAEITSVSDFTHLESKVATDLRLAIARNQLVVTDAQFIAGLAERTTPPALVDTSAVRITSHYLTLTQLESATSNPQVHAVLFFTGRFYLPNVVEYHSWVAKHFHLLHNYGKGIELWVR